MEYTVEIHRILTWRLTAVAVVSLLAWLVLAGLVVRRRRLALAGGVFGPSAAAAFLLTGEAGKLFSLQPQPGYLVFFYLAAIWLAWLMGVIMSAPLLWGLGRLRSGRWRQGQRWWLTALALIVVYGVWAGVNDLNVNHYRLSDRRIGQPVRMVQISDVHIGNYIDQNDWRSILAASLAERPDLLLITGDLLDDYRQLPATAAALAAIVPAVPGGVYFCYGNHDYFYNWRALTQQLEASGVVVLKDGGRPLAVGGAGLYLAGVDYVRLRDKEARLAAMTEGIGLALSGRSGDQFTVLLAHHPDNIPLAAAAGADLTLTGHTHGGQVGIAGQSPLAVLYRYMRGWFGDGGRYRAYVSVGSGHWFPFRLGCPREIAVIDLVPGN
ncbi:MAG: metallophosphoesterase [Negativicutes bacterium]|nr:metallophosphoesterase [Negativicutes bacterium]